MPSRRRDIHVSFTWSDAYTRGSWAIRPGAIASKVSTMSAKCESVWQPRVGSRSPSYSVG
jgi:hypothetical protein